MLIGKTDIVWPSDRGFSFPESFFEVCDISLCNSVLGGVRFVFDDGGQTEWWPLRRMSDDLFCHCLWGPLCSGLYAWGYKIAKKKTESKNIDSPSRKGYWSVRSRSRRRGWWWPTQVVFLKPFWIPFCVTICANPFSQSHFQSTYTRDVKADVSVGWSEMQYSVMRDDPKGIAIWMRRRRLAFGE